ncbi:MAG: GNAT family N-acetyltransferase [Thermoflexales bacterium]|nr:GNAT family N-acetyltransferase [Thermoflexales bacterium]
MSSLGELDVQVAHSVEQIGQESWDRLAAGRPFTGYHWYRFGETVLAGSLPIYMVLSQQGEPLARATFWLTRQEFLPISSAPLRRLMQAFIRRWPLLICRTPLVCASGLIVPKGVLGRSALATIAQVAREQAQQHKASFVIFDYLEQQDLSEPSWPASFVPVEMPNPDTCLWIDWPDFDSYLGQLGHKMRTNYRRDCRIANSLGIEIESRLLKQPMDEASLDEAMRLFRNVEKHHNSPPYPWARGMLRHACQVDALWLTAKLEKRLVAWCLALRDGDYWYGALAGLDYQVRYAYFQLVYATIEHAIQQGARIIRGGSWAYNLKQKLGFQLVYNTHLMFTSSNPWLRRIGRWLS